MKLSATGVIQLVNFEGLKVRAYRDTRGIWTIGVGDTTNVSPGMVITIEEAFRRLRERLAHEFEPNLTKQIGTARTDQYQFDAMLLLSYNIGSHAFGTSEVLQYHNAARYEDAAKAFSHWQHSNGRLVPALVKRRAAEAALYLTAIR